MNPLIILLSGTVCSGKTTLATEVNRVYNVHHLSTREFLIRAKANLPAERGRLQREGEALDKRTKGAWLRDELTRELSVISDNKHVILDSVRALSQIERIRESYGSRVIHLHLEASDRVLEQRYQERKRTGNNPVKEMASYKDVQKNLTESKVPNLRVNADVVIQTDRCTVQDVVTRVACQLGLHGRAYPRSVDVVVGGQYGSEGKGQIAAYLAPEYDLLIRVGGPNAGHKVYGDPPYTFHQLPSGTKNSRAQLLIGPGAVINLETLLREIADCDVDVNRLAIDPNAVIVQTRDIKDEQRTIRGTIGSTAQGVGEATVRRLRRRQSSLPRFAKDEKRLKPFVHCALDVIAEHQRADRKILLEGTQGTGLSLYHGSYPHVTSRDTTVAGCLSEAGISPSCVRKIVMVCRSYPIRVASPEKGSSGPMGQEISLAEISRRSGIKLDELEVTERTSTTNRRRRIAEFDWRMLSQAAQLNAPTDIALTFVDYLDVKNRKARRFEQLQQDSILFIEEVERVALARVSLISTRFHSRAVIDRRHW